MKRLVIPGLAAVIMSLATVPVASADSEGSVNGSFAVNSAGPDITAIALYDSAHTSTVTAMDPQVEYAVKVDISHPNKLKHLSSLKVTVFFDSDGDNSSATVPGAGNTQNAAVLTCTVGATPSWSIDAGAGTTWSVISADCMQPDIGNTTGTFWFNFKPGKVATEATNWDIYGYALDQSARTANLYNNGSYSMNWRGEIAVSGNVTFGSVSLGSDFADNTQTGVTNAYIANGNYGVNIKASTPWAGTGDSVALNTSGTPGDGEFSLKALATNTLASAATVTNAYTAMDSTGTQTAEGGSSVNTNTIWLKVGGNGLSVTTYSGTIYYQINNR